METKLKQGFWWHLAAMQLGRPVEELTLGEVLAVRKKVVTSPMPGGTYPASNPRPA
jgi:hypothetical protein